MPRDQKGHIFGIGSVVQTATGETLTVCGFAVANHPIDRATTQAIAELACAGHCDPTKPTRAYYWHEVTLKDPEKDEWAKHGDHTDTCYMDAAQKEGLAVPADRQGVQTLAVAAQADKWVWGT